MAVIWVLSVLPGIAIFAAPTRHQLERAENVVFGIAVGVGASLLLIVASAIASTWGAFSLGGSRSRRFIVGFTGLSVVVGLQLLLISFLLRKPFLGVVAFVGWGIPLAAMYLAFQRAFGLHGRGVALLIGCAGVAAATGLLARADGRPARIQFAERQEEELTVLSWNLGLGQPLSSASQVAFLPRVAETILASGADIVTLQEVASQEHLDRLLADLGPPWRGSISAQRYQVTGVVTRVPGELRCWQPNLPYGGPISITVQTESGSLEIASVHFPPEQKSRQREIYAQWLASQANDREHPVLFAGDLNVDPEGWWDRCSPMFTDSVLRDRRSLDILGHQRRDVGREAAATAALSRRLDYFFVPDSLQCIEYRVLFGKKQGRMDHHPICLRIKS